MNSVNTSNRYIEKQMPRMLSVNNGRNINGMAEFIILEKV